MLVFIILSILVSLARVAYKDYPEQIFTKYAVNTEVKEASDIGANIIKRGGNAIDAAIGAALSIGVVNSFSSGIGGGGFALIRIKGKDGKDDVLDYIDFREVSPQNVNIDELTANIEFRSKTGRSVGIPGEVMGLYKMHKKYGRMPWKDIFTEVIELSKEFQVSELLVKKINNNLESIAKDPGLSEIYLKDGKVIKAGSSIKRLNYANTLKIISENPMDFYNGNLAKRIVNVVNENGGYFSIKDLNEYKAKSRAVLKGSFYDYDVFTTNLPTSGAFVIEALNALERLNIRDLKSLSNNQNSYYLYHLILEVMKFIISSKSKFGDPDFLKDWKRKLSVVMSDEKAKKIARKFKINYALTYKDYDFDGKLVDDHGTTHLNVADPYGNIVALTSTINLEFGSKIMDPETGIIFNNHINDFYFSPNEKIANSIEPKKRPLSSASPLILMKEDEIIVLGGAGGSRITTSIILFVGYLMAGNSINECIGLTRMHAQLDPNIIYIEGNPTLNDKIVDKLKEMGHKILVSSINSTYSSLQAIQIRKKNENLEMIAVSDHRKNGKSSGE